MIRLFSAVSLLASFLVLGGSVLASQDAQVPRATVKPLTNADVLDMLSAGFSQEIVVAKIAASAWEFDTSLTALKALKTSNVPDAVVLAMVQAATGSRRQGLTKGEPSGPARIDCKHTDPIPAYSAPRTQRSSNDARSDFVEVFKVKCGERITLFNPGDKQSWLKIRNAEGQVGYISFALVSMEQSVESAPPTLESKKRDDLQKANDDLEDCRVPMSRVAASTRLKQNLDAELRQCRSQYGFRLKAIEGEEK